MELFFLNLTYFIYGSYNKGGSSEVCIVLLDYAATNVSELKARSASLKQMHALKTAFVKLTNCTNWEEAISKFPEFATMDRLRKF